MDVIGLIVGIWFIAVGAYSFYYAAAIKQDGKNIKTGWIVGRNIQLKNCKDTKGFINAIYKKTLVFAGIDIAGGLGFIIAQYIPKVGYVMKIVCMLVLVIDYFIYSSAIKTAQKTYLSPSFKSKANQKL